MKNLPNFELAPLSTFPINVMTDTRYASERELSFIVAASCAYNDMKDFFWLFQQLTENSPDDPNVITPERGQHTAMVVFVTRGLIGVFHEFLTLLRKNRDVLSGEALSYAGTKLRGNAKENWEHLQRFAKLEESDLSIEEQQILNAVREVRNNVGSHYYGTRNYSEGLAEYIKRESSAKIHVSFGDTMMSSRFFFADAAAQYKKIVLIEDQNSTLTDVLEYVKKMNSGVRFIIESFIVCQNMILNGSREDKRSEERARSSKYKQ